MKTAAGDKVRIKVGAHCGERGVVDGEVVEDRAVPGEVVLVELVVVARDGERLPDPRQPELSWRQT